MGPGATSTEDRRSDSATRTARRQRITGGVRFRPPTGAALARAMSSGAMRGTGATPLWPPAVPSPPTGRPPRRPDRPAQRSATSSTCDDRGVGDAAAPGRRLEEGAAGDPVRFSRVARGHRRRDSSACGLRRPEGAQAAAGRGAQGSARSSAGGGCALARLRRLGGGAPSVGRGRAGEGALRCGCDRFPGRAGRRRGWIVRGARRGPWG